jgi:hypothetical protein
MVLWEGLLGQLLRATNGDGPDALGLLYGVDVHFKELTDDLDIRRRMARHRSRPKSSRAGERDWHQELVRKVTAHRHPRRDVGTCLLGYLGSERLGTYGHVAEAAVTVCPIGLINGRNVFAACRTLPREMRLRRSWYRATPDPVRRANQ